MELERNKELNHTFIKMKPIWILDDDNRHVIEGKIVVTDENKLKEVISDLQNLDTYIYNGIYWRRGSVTNHLEYTSHGAIRYQNSGKASSHTEYVYQNPKAEVYQFITGDDRSTNDLLDLFASLECRNNMAFRQQEFQNAQIVIERLRNSNLDPSVIQDILKRMWPNFGYYATECLDCTDIYPTRIYDLAESSSNQVEDFVVSNPVVAERNGKILSLAREAYKISR